MRAHVAMGGPLAFCSLGALVVLLGCDSGPKLPPMAKVTGTVMLDGKPLPTGMIQFLPNRKKGTPAGPPAVGEIDKNGRFTLTTAGVEGALVGWHRVRVSAQDLSGGGKDLNGEPTPAPWLIPIRYNKPATSGLEFEVKADEKNDFTVELTVKGGE